MNLIKVIYQYRILSISLLFFFSNNLKSQVSIREFTEDLKTYEFSDPNPIPIFISNPKIYPYFTFDGYSIESKSKKFKVIELENNYIKVLITPELGGKVWGAIDKTSGEEFIYKNEVVKFRNISMRGPWTSGGIEFNFGIIGHHPSTATPVDYKIRKNADGSISCFVGNIDLPSRSQWRVEIIVKNDQASFLTDALWYNPTPINQSYYNWMTAAAPASDDLVFYTPGDIYLEHSGNAKNWPIDHRGRDLSKYKNNNFGPSKSYHIVGEYNDFFGGYYNKSDYGFGHWGKYEDIPGQKLWLWSQSRAGGIWEDLLTDNDGQYIEFQAGRLLVQYSPNNDINPITNVGFEPYAIDEWSEAWFPLKKINGLSEASEFGALYVERDKDSIEIKLNPFIKINSTMNILIDDKIYYEEELSLDPMDVFETKINLDINKDFEIIIEKLDLHYLSNKSYNKIERSFTSRNEDKSNKSYQKLLNEAKENMSYREYDKAKEKFQKIVDHDKYNLEAISNLGELYYRSGQFEKSLTIVKDGLKIDTYHPSLNYIAGINYKALNDNINSKESLGWAARSIKYRSNAYSQIADIFLKEKKFNRAIEYAKKSLEFNINNIPSLEIIAISNRYLKKNIEHNKAIQKIEELDPINHIISFEKYINEPNEDKINDILNSHQSELKHQTFLELAIRYFNRGLKEEAVKILNIGPQKMINNLWISYLTKNTNKLESIVNKNKIDFSFPFRTETIDVINWARNSYSNWKLDYLIALNLYGKGRYNESKNILSKIEDESLNPIFYLNRGIILQKNGVDPLKDFNKAYQLDNKNWRVSKSLSNYYYDLGHYTKANKILEKSYQNDISNYIIGMDYVKSLVKLKKYVLAISILKKLNILPYEHAGEGRDLYSSAYIGLALENIKKSKFKSAVDILHESKMWPENLGVGKPYNPDERIENYLIYYCLEKLNDQSSKKYLSDVASYSQMNIENIDANHILGYVSLNKIHGDEKSDEFLKNLIDKHGTDSEQINLILNYKIDGNLEDENNFYLLREILKLK